MPASRMNWSAALRLAAGCLCCLYSRAALKGVFKRILSWVSFYESGSCKVCAAVDPHRAEGKRDALGSTNPRRGTGEQ